jgi:cytochrome c oxidase subunit 3
MFYAATGAMTFLLIAGILFTAVAAFRYLGGRTKELEVVSSHALYWYFLTAVFTAVWFVIYVQK